MMAHQEAEEFRQYDHDDDLFRYIRRLGQFAQSIRVFLEGEEATDVFIQTHRVWLQERINRYQIRNHDLNEFNLGSRNDALDSVIVLYTRQTPFFANFNSYLRTERQGPEVEFHNQYMWYCSMIWISANKTSSRQGTPFSDQRGGHRLEGNQVLYRGTKLPAILQPGELYVNPQVFSTSTNRDIAWRFARDCDATNSNRHFIIVTGTEEIGQELGRILGFAHHPSYFRIVNARDHGRLTTFDEDEVLILPPFVSKVTVRKEEVANDGIHQVTMEHISYWDDENDFSQEEWMHIGFLAFHFNNLEIKRIYHFIPGRDVSYLALSAVCANCQRMIVLTDFLPHEPPPPDDFGRFVTQLQMLVGLLHTISQGHPCFPHIQM